LNIISEGQFLCEICSNTTSKLFKVLLYTGTAEVYLVKEDQVKMIKFQHVKDLLRMIYQNTTINLCYNLVKFTPHHTLVHLFGVDNTPKHNRN